MLSSIKHGWARQPAAAARTLHRVVPNTRPVTQRGQAATRGARHLYTSAGVGATSSSPLAKQMSLIAAAGVASGAGYMWYTQSAQSAAMCEAAPQKEYAKEMETYVLQLQKQIVSAVEKEDGGKFFIDRWEREDGKGYGISCVLQDSVVFEKGGVNITVMDGKMSPAGAKQMRMRHSELPGKGDDPIKFKAVGLSLVIHPRNPHAPTIHCNYRYFEIPSDKPGEPHTWWFGGGVDLTPIYLYEEDAVHFHKGIKNALDKHSPEYYPMFKKDCDEYFYLKHRNEARGVGGIFFDDLNMKSPQCKSANKEELFQMVKSCGDAFVDGYIPIVAKRKKMPFTEEQKEWQRLRRGRYVEFNLVWDRGTKFGFMTPGARIESILMSLPLHADWKYMHKPEPGTPEAKLLDCVQNPRDWVK
eukprot:GFYU01009478.1.p2 GENE.GFYU01009478.1~~GFYU01009478.1.p2  ORF type:complete len:414 (+),score=98.38 GFYU01009478.1:92-1333(+)